MDNETFLFWLLGFVVIAMAANAIHILFENISEWLELRRKNKRF